MSFHDWFNAITGTTGSGETAGHFVNSTVYANETNPCADNGNQKGFNCVEVIGSDGAYSSLSQCESDTNSKCNTDCSVPNLVTAHPVNGVISTVAGATCNGSVSVEVYLSGNATSWSVHYEDMSQNIVAVDTTSYTVGGYSSNQSLAEGSYKAVVKDSLNCVSEIKFDIVCDPLPCQTSPGNFTVSTTDPTFNVSTGKCWEIGDSNALTTTDDGSISISNTLLLPPATSWGYELYLNTPGGQIPVADGTGFSALLTIDIQGLQEGVYTIKYTDDTTCVYNDVDVILNCTASPQVICDQSTFPNYNIQVQPATSSDCPTVYNTAPTVGTNNDGQVAFSSIICQPAATYFTIEILYGNITTGFNSVYNSGQILTIAPQPILGPGNLFSTDTVAAANTPPYNTGIYVAVVTDSLGCERRTQFQVPCQQSRVNTSNEDPTYECVSMPNIGGGFTSSCQPLYDGSGTYSSLAACQAVCSDNTQGVLNWKCTSPGNLCQPTADPVNYVDVFDDQFDCNISCGLTTGPGA